MTLDVFSTPEALAAILAGTALLGVIAVAAVMVWRQREAEKHRRHSEHHEAELRRSLEQVLSAQNQLAGQLAAQQGENATLRQALDQRLDAVAKGVQDNLSQQSEKTRASLTQLNERLVLIDQAQKRFDALSKDLSGQVGGLTDILSNKQRRGQFGEIQMQDLIADMLPVSSYSFQPTLANGKKPDALIHLPNPPGPLVVDSKFPLEAYRAYAEGEGRDAQEAAKRFQQDVKAHATAIHERYVLADDTAEWAVMFLPSEAVFAALHAEFPKTVEECLRRRVGLVSPSTFMALLTSVRAVLRDAQLREEGARLQKLLADMLQDLRRLDERIARAVKNHDQAGEHLRTVQTSVNQFSNRADKVLNLDLSSGEEEGEAEPDPVAAAVESAVKRRGGQF
jgi:DNA recombination protein RmuC